MCDYGGHEKKLLKILTFDIEDWFHLLDHHATESENEWCNFPSRIHQNVDRVLSILENSNTRATFFILGWIAEKYPEVVKKISNLGYELGSHTHLHKLIFNQDDKSFKKDLERSIKTLEDISGQNIKYFRAPGFSITENTKWVFDELVKLGIKIDCSIFPANRSYGGFPNFGNAEPTIININGQYIKELPINMCSVFGLNFVFSGGGYFRLLPYWIIKLFMENSNYVMSYFHPRDFDYEQPVLKDLSRLRRFKSYYGLKGSLHKIEKLIKDFKFIDINTANDLIDWKCVKVIDLN